MPKTPAVRRYRQKLRDYVQERKEKNPCTDCKEFFPYYVMDFDHVRGEKLFNPGNMYAHCGLAKIKAELKKCDLVCANCHRKRTHARR